MDIGARPEGVRNCRDAKTRACCVPEGGLYEIVHSFAFIYPQNITRARPKLRSPAWVNLLQGFFLDKPSALLPNKCLDFPVQAHELMRLEALTWVGVQPKIALSTQAHFYDRQEHFALPGYGEARCGRHCNRPTRTGFIQVGLNIS